MPPIEPEVQDYRLHRLPCPHCNTVTFGALPNGNLRKVCGPSMHEALSVLSGASGLSKRQVAQLGSDPPGLTIFSGMIAKLERVTTELLEQPVVERAEAVKKAKRSEHRRHRLAESYCKTWLWVVVTYLGVTFRMVRSRAVAVTEDLLGDEPKPVVISDRFPANEWTKLGSRQICWAHLRRDFQAMSDRDRHGAEVGRRLLWQSNKLFEHRHKVRDGTIRRSTFLPPETWQRPMVRSTLKRGVGVGLPENGDDLRRVAATLGLDVDLHAGSKASSRRKEKNAAERTPLRHAVIWPSDQWRQRQRRPEMVHWADALDAGHVPIA